MKESNDSNNSVEQLQLKNPGVVAINKPLNITSHDVIDRVRKITGMKRVGHAGTLDPLATGVLVVLIGRQNTRRQAEFMGHPKAYVAEVTFGSTSQTYDGEGPFTNTATAEQLQSLTAEQVQAVLPQFVGTITQQPPMYSAIKVDGEPLYKKARRGEITQADVPTREVTIDAVTLTGFTPATDTTAPIAYIRIECQKGVYIRSLSHDIGQAVEMGAYMSALERTAVGAYTVEHALTLEEFADQWTPEQLLAIQQS